MENNCGCNGEKKHEENCGCGCEGEHEHGENCGCGEEHGHGCGCEDENKVDIINLVLDDGTEEKCEIIGVFDLDENDYIALLNEEDDVYIYKYEEQDSEHIDLINIEDDEEFDKVAETFFDLFDGEED